MNVLDYIENRNLGDLLPHIVSLVKVWYKSDLIWVVYGVGGWLKMTDQKIRNFII